MGKRFTFFPGGIHPPQRKHTKQSAIQEVEAPMRVTLGLNQHFGAPAKAVVKVGDKVARGTKIADAQGYMSVPVHTPITGTVKAVGQMTDLFGKAMPAVVIEATEEEHNLDMSREVCRRMSEKDVALLTPEQIRRVALEAGIVGMGGAAFPTHVKLTPPAGMDVDTLLLNGAECEPHLTCDDRLMIERANSILRGARLAARAVGAHRIIVGIESNKPMAIDTMRRAAMSDTCAELEITVQPLVTKYPQGGEKQLIYALTGRVTPTGGLPASVGCVVMNVSTAYALARAVYYGEPLMERVVTLSSDTAGVGGNFKVSIGDSLSRLISLAEKKSAADDDGGSSPEISKIVSGGPMMGRAVANPDAPISKGTSGFTFLTAATARRGKVQPCIKCARCAEVCPMGLEPFLISTLSRFGMWDEAKRQSVLNCVECGSCQWVCPSSRPLLDFIRTGKNAVRLLMKQKK